MVNVGGATQALRGDNATGQSHPAMTLPAVFSRGHCPEGDKLRHRPNITQ
jgi:hypothetical protein